VRRDRQRWPAADRRAGAAGTGFAEAEGRGPGDTTWAARAATRMRRVLHTGDITGREIERGLLSAVAHGRACRGDDGALHGHRPDHDRLAGAGHENRCVGAYVLDRAHRARSPPCARRTRAGHRRRRQGLPLHEQSGHRDRRRRGHGVAGRAADQANMEFIQFHPTCLYHPAAKSFLISEAVRGEGAELVDAGGESFMERYDPRGALAPARHRGARHRPRDEAHGAPCVYLDIRHKPDVPGERFPNIYLRPAVSSASTWPAT
jgi:L-aspartate oxidase